MIVCSSPFFLLFVFNFFQDIALVPVNASSKTSHVDEQAKADTWLFLRRLRIATAPALVVGVLSLAGGKQECRGNSLKT